MDWHTRMHNPHCDLPPLFWAVLAACRATRANPWPRLVPGLYLHPQ